MFLTSCHHQTKLIRVGLIAGYGADDLAAEYDIDRIGQAHDLVKLK